MSKLRILIINIFFIICLVSFGDGENLYDYKVLLVGDNKGKIIRSENSKVVRPIASITKVMTSLLVFEKIESGEISLDDVVIVSKEASEIPYGVRLKDGDSHTVRDLLKATIIKSSNSAAYALGEYVTNYNIENFIQMMNKKAKELGLYSLRYCSPHGLPPKYTNSCMDQGNAEDIYKLAVIMSKYSGYLNISKNKTDSMSNGTALISTNNLLGNVEGVDGLKTGYHIAAGSNIVLTAKRNNNRMFVVILGSEKAKNRDAIGKKEIEEYFSKNIIKKEENNRDITKENEEAEKIIKSIIEQLEKNKK